MSIRSDMSKNEDQLKDLQRYRRFLDKLTPKEFLDKHSPSSHGISNNNKDGSGSKSDGHNVATFKSNNKKGNDALLQPEAPLDASESVQGDLEEIDDILVDEESGEPVLFFSSPQQLLDLFAELEENNLSLIQNCQETEETLEELKAKIQDTTVRMYKLSVF